MQDGRKEIVRLDGDKEQVLDDMLRWLYSYEYFPNFDIEVIKNLDPNGWERHIDAAIIADKYGIPSMEKYAMEVCDVCLATFIGGPDIDLSKLLKRVLEYPDRKGKLASMIADYCPESFPEVFRIEGFRVWLAKHPKIKKDLIDRNFSELIKIEEFREYLSADSDTALRDIDRLMGFEEGKATEKKGKKRKGSPVM